MKKFISRGNRWNVYRDNLNVVKAWENVYGEETDEIFIDKILTLWLHKHVYSGNRWNIYREDFNYVNRWENVYRVETVDLITEDFTFMWYHGLSNRK